MTTTRLTYLFETVRHGIFAGMAGGLAELLWIAFYGSLTGSDSAQVARTISAVVSAAIPGTVSISVPVAFGIVIHMIAASVLGVALIFILRLSSIRSRQTVDEFGFMLAALTIVWLINFFVVLPLISPLFVDLNRSFVDIIPYPISLCSKLLFGLAAATTLRHCGRDRSALMHA